MKNKLFFALLSLGVLIYYIKNKVEFKDDLDWNEIFKDF